MQRIYINLVFEDDLSEYVLARLIDSFDGKFEKGYSFHCRGFGKIKLNINCYNQACGTIPFLVLTDLDQKECPLTLINSWFGKPIHPNMIFRVAVREVEAWLLADTEGFSGFIGVSEARLPRDPEKENDPKLTLINLARRSKKRDIKSDIVPVNENASIGPNYNGCLGKFVTHFWSIERAMEKGESLKRAYQRLRNFEPAV